MPFEGLISIGVKLLSWFNEAMLSLFLFFLVFWDLEMELFLSPTTLASFLAFEIFWSIKANSFAIWSFGYAVNVCLDDLVKSIF